MGGKQQSYDRLGDYGPAIESEADTERDDDFIRWLRTGGHRSNGPLMSKIPVLFIGGPWDGKRELMETAPERFYVAQLQKVSNHKDKLDAAAMTDVRVQYIKVNLTGNFVYFAAPDLDFDKHPVSEAVKRLIENYKAIS